MWHSANGTRRRALGRAVCTVIQSFIGASRSRRFLKAPDKTSILFTLRGFSFTLMRTNRQHRSQFLIALSTLMAVLIVWFSANILLMHQATQTLENTPAAQHLTHHEQPHSACAGMSSMNNMGDMNHCSGGNHQNAAKMCQLNCAVYCIGAIPSVLPISPSFIASVYFPPSLDTDIRSRQLAPNTPPPKFS